MNCNGRASPVHGSRESRDYKNKPGPRATREEKMDVFSAGEILQFAIKIEENGEAFYLKHAEAFFESRARELFRHLAREEARHRKTFQDMLAKVETYTPSESYPDEYFAYLRAYVDDIIFSEGTLEREMQTIKDVISALDFSMRRETESIFYYQEVKKFVPEDQHALIEGIIEEERKHFTSLHETKQFFKKSN
jgi:rubrerythrin